MIYFKQHDFEINNKTECDKLREQLGKLSQSLVKYAEKRIPNSNWNARVSNANDYKLHWFSLSIKNTHSKKFNNEIVLSIDIKNSIVSFAVNIEYKDTIHDLIECCNPSHIDEFLKVVQQATNAKICIEKKNATRDSKRHYEPWDKNFKEIVTNKCSNEILKSIPHILNKKSDDNIAPILLIKYDLSLNMLMKDNIESELGHRVELLAPIVNFLEYKHINKKL